MVNTRSGKGQGRLEVRLRARDPADKRGTRSVQVQAVPMETEEVAASLAPASPGTPQQGGARKRARSVSPEPGKLEPGVEGEQGEWREGSSEESEGEESLPPGDRVAYIHVGEVSQHLHNLYTFCA